MAAERPGNLRRNAWETCDRIGCQLPIATAMASSVRMSPVGITSSPGTTDLSTEGCRSAGFETLLHWMDKGYQWQELTLAAMQKQFSLPHHRPLPTQSIDQHPLQNYDEILFLHSPSQRRRRPRGGATQICKMRLARIRLHWRSIARAVRHQGYAQPIHKQVFGRIKQASGLRQLRTSGRSEGEVFRLHVG